MNKDLKKLYELINTLVSEKYYGYIKIQFKGGVPTILYEERTFRLEN